MNPESFKEKLVQISTEPGSGCEIDFQKLNTIYEKKKNPDAMIEDPEAVADLLDQNKIYVCWQVKEEKVNAELVKRIQIFCTQNLKVGRAIMIVQGQTPLSKKEENEELSMVPIEIIQLSDLQVNITHHKMVPKHSVLSDEDTKELLDKYRIKKHQLPKIQMSDPVAKYFGVSRGQVMKIIRSSETAGRYVTYRIAY